MANNTIYPYGTSGSIPASIGIINDLETGGANNALSAEMGKALSKEIDGVSCIERKIDVVGLYVRIFNYIKVSNNQWTASSSSNSSFNIAIHPGWKYKIVGGSAQGRYAMLTSNDQTAGATPSYATGWTAVKYIAAGAEVIVTAPDNALYLNITYKISGTVIVPASITEYVPMKDAMPPSQWLADVRIGEDYEISLGRRCVDTNTANQTFGQLIQLPVNDTNYSTTQYIGLYGCKQVSLYCTLASTSNNVANLTGVVFYDENYLPMTQGVYVVRKESAASQGYITLDVPDGAQYVRATVYYNSNFINGTNKVYLYQGDNSGALFTGNYYQGEKIVMNPDYKYRRELVANNGVAGQSAAVYGKYLFIVTKYLASVTLYNMETHSQIYTLTTGITQDESNHCNQSSFGTLKYDSNDMFPVLYISQRGSNQRAAIQVYRIIPTLTDNEISSFTISLVQTINMPTETAQNCLGYPNLAIDTERNCMWTYSRNRLYSDAATYGKACFTRFTIPALTNSVVTLEDSDIKDSFIENWAIYDNQGAFIHRGKLYMMRGTGGDGITECNVIDLYFNRTRVSRVDMYADGISFEPEGCFYYDNTVHCVNSSGYIYKLIFSE